MSRIQGAGKEQQVRGESLLADAGSYLASSLDYDETLAGVADLAVRFLADYCVIDIVEDGDIRRVKAAHADPEQAELTGQLLRFPLDRRLPHMSLQALESGEPVLVREVTAAMVESITQGDEHRRIVEKLRPRSFMAVPLLARDRLFGVVLFVSSSTRYDEEDLALAMRLVHLAALEVDNARLYREARQALLARDQVLGIVAHDLRNPLNTVMMSAELLLGDSIPEARRGRQAQMILRSAERMNRLIQDLLDAVKIEAEQLYLLREVQEPQSLMEEAVEYHLSLARTRSLVLRHESGADMPAISGDRDRLLQVLSNLIGNAIKFTPEGGRIDVRVELVEEGVMFSVADTGPGIACDDLPHLFQPFWQSQPGRLDGAGLGLTIARGIVEAHGGRIWAESIPGQGSTFYFTIPAMSEPHKRERRHGHADRRARRNGVAAAAA